MFEQTIIEISLDIRSGQSAVSFGEKLRMAGKAKG
jgi:hypothetical protein